MPLKVIKLDSTAAKVGVIIFAVVFLAGCWFSARWDIASAVAYRGLDPRQPEMKQLADWMIETAPDDPLARAASSRYFEQTFESDDLSRSLTDIEAATALSPNHFEMWVRLGAARDRAGDASGAEAAYGRALELAPNYAPVQWSYGNSLVRHGKTDEGFKLMADAVQSDPRYANPAVGVALHAFDGSADGVRRALGDTPEINAGLVQVFGSQKKFGDAVEAWMRIPQEAKRSSTTFADIGKQLAGLTAEAKETRLAAIVAGDISTGEADRPSVGKITNGGFESGVKVRNAGLFEWRIAEGGEPQIGLSESVKRSGRYSLWLTFDSFEAEDFRTIAQRVAVVPGATYMFEGYYRAEIKTKVEFKWEIVDIVSGQQLAATEPLALNGDWASMGAKFTVPATSDGIDIRFIRLGCGGACPVTGKISFDDLSIRQL